MFHTFDSCEVHSSVFDLSLRYKKGVKITCERHIISTTFVCKGVSPVWNFMYHLSEQKSGLSVTEAKRPPKELNLAVSVRFGEFPLRAL